MAFLQKGAGGNPSRFADELLGKRPAVHEEIESKSGISNRLYRDRIDQPGPRKHADHSGQGTARGLVLVEIYCCVFYADVGGNYCGNPVGIAIEGTGGRLEDVEAPKFRSPDITDVFPALRVVFERSAY